MWGCALGSLRAEVQQNALPLPQTLSHHPLWLVFLLYQLLNILNNLLALNALFKNKSDVK